MNGYDEAYIKRQEEKIREALVYHHDRDNPTAGSYCYGNLRDCYDAGWKAAVEWIRDGWAK